MEKDGWKPLLAVHSILLNYDPARVFLHAEGLAGGRASATARRFPGNSSQQARLPARPGVEYPKTGEKLCSLGLIAEDPRTGAQQALSSQ